MLDGFVVAAQREMSGSAIALNERRAAANLKNVVAADEFGDSLEGNVAEFVKYLPGVAIDYNASDPRWISVRGMPSFGTAVMIDGNRMASAADNFSRGTEFNQVSLNNMSRIEVTKSPLPDTPADTVGGSVNMVLKSAFERAKPLLTYRLALNANFRDLEGDNFIAFDGSPTARGRLTTLKPGYDLNYTNPLSKNLGFSVSLMNSNGFNPDSPANSVWKPTTVASSLAPADRPYLSSVTASDRPKLIRRWSGGTTVDWRISPRDVLSIGAQWNRLQAVVDLGDVTFDVNGTSNVAPRAYGPTMTESAPGAGRVTHTITTFNKRGRGYNFSATYRHTGSVWSAAAGTAFSGSKSVVLSAQDGVVKSMILQLSNLTLRMDGIKRSVPASYATSTVAGVPVDFRDLSNYTLTSLTEGTPQDQRSFTNSVYANATRWVQIRVPVRLKAGVDVRLEDRDFRNPTTNLTFLGRDGVANSGDERAGLYDLLDEKYSQLTLPHGVGRMQKPSIQKVYAMLQQNPGWFSRSLTSAISSEATQSRKLMETVGAGYLRADVSLIENRLKLAGGVRYERTYDEGYGLLNDISATYQKDAGGRIVRDAAGRPVRVTTDPVELARLQFKDRGSYGKRHYGQFYPSLNASYQLTNKTLVRTSYAKTITRPQLTTIIPSATASDPTATGTPTISVNNTALKPWTSDNFDVAFEYYFDKPGLVSVGAFRKNISDFFGSVRELATPELLEQYGFDESYMGYEIVTRENIGSATVTGFELDYRQTLTALPSWARGLAVFANLTNLRVEGGARADFSGFISRTANWGISLNRPRYSVKLNWNYRGRQRSGQVTGTNVPAGTYSYAAPRLSTDLNVEVRVTRYAALFGSVRNLASNAWRSEVYGPGTPYYARGTALNQYGPQAVIGVKGSF